MDFPFRRVALVGLGLMGGSLARALRALADPPHLLGFSSDPAEAEAALREGLLDAPAGRTADFLPDRDLLVYACPLQATLELMEAHAPFLGPETVVTDVVSLKEPLIRRALELGLGERFVGSHPMAGGTETGFGASRPGLFRDARVWITPAGAPEERIKGVEAFWEMLGARPERMEAPAHDRMMAWVSHLPQLTSNALALALMKAGHGPAHLGPGGRDMTRLAGSGAGMWDDLLQEGGAPLLEALAKLEGELAGLRELLAQGKTNEVGKIMTRTASWLKEGA